MRLLATSRTSSFTASSAVVSGATAVLVSSRNEWNFPKENA